MEIENYLFPPASSGESCLHVIDAFRKKYPPVAEVGDPPTHTLVNQKIIRASLLWRITEPHNPTFYNYTCIDEVRNTCWDYCGEGIEQPGAFHLYCITTACMNHTSDPIEEETVNNSAEI